MPEMLSSTPTFAKLFLVPFSPAVSWFSCKLLHGCKYIRRKCSRRVKIRTSGRAARGVPSQNRFASRPQLFWIKGPQIRRCDFICIQASRSKLPEALSREYDFHRRQAIAGATISL